MRERLPTFVAVVIYGLISSFASADVCRRLSTEPSHGENRGSSPLAPPNFLRIIGQVSHFLWLAEKDGEVRENLLDYLAGSLSKTLIETGELTQEQCIYYLVALAQSIPRRQAQSR